MAAQNLEREATEVKTLRNTFENGVLERIPGVHVNGDREQRLPNTSNLYFEGVEADGALLLLERTKICASAGSACKTGSLAPSHVLKAMGFSHERARGSLRFSFSRFNTADEIAQALEIIPGIIAKLRGNSRKEARKNLRSSAKSADKTSLSLPDFLICRRGWR